MSERPDGAMLLTSACLSAGVRRSPLPEWRVAACGAVWLSSCFASLYKHELMRARQLLPTTAYCLSAAAREPPARGNGAIRPRKLRSPPASAQAGYERFAMGRPRHRSRHRRLRYRCCSAASQLRVGRARHATQRATNAAVGRLRARARLSSCHRPQRGSAALSPAKLAAETAPAATQAASRPARQGQHDR
jgi:hypothetical protein